VLQLNHALVRMRSPPLSIELWRCLIIRLLTLPAAEVGGLDPQQRRAAEDQMRRRCSSQRQSIERISVTALDTGNLLSRDYIPA
jgi:hypothetical protein